MNYRLKVKNLILKCLFSSSSGRLDSYSVFRKIKVSFPEFNKSLLELKNGNYIDIDGIIVSITIRGREYILKDNNASTLLVKKWREVPNDMLGHKLDVNYKYVPSIRLLDAQLKIEK